MKMMKLSGIVAAVGMLLIGTASAAPMAPMGRGVGQIATEIAYMRKGSAAAKMKQRHRTRLDRCNNKPSRC